MLAQCKIHIIIMYNNKNTNLIIVDIWKTMELRLCRGVHAGLLGDGTVGKDGLLSSCAHNSLVLSSKVLINLLCKNVCNSKRAN